MSKIIIPYKPRDAFLDYHETDKRFCLTVAHRRAGKTVARVNKLIKKAILCELPNPRFRYLAPFYVQAKDIAWLYLKHYSAPLIALGGKVNESELSVTFPHNNAVIKLYGAENAERMRGLYSDGDVIDEGQGISKSVLSQIILPSLADRKGWLDVSGTPKGWSNLLGELVKLAKGKPDQWFLQILKASETGIIPEEELERQRELMSEDEYNQEFECDFDAAITGSVYGKQIAKIESLGRNKENLYDNQHIVYTAWDLGYDDSTAIWWWQKIGNEIRLIDYYENAGQNIEHYCEILKGKSYKYGKHYVPHDAANKLLAAGGRSIVQQAYALGITMFVIPATSQQNGIEALRKTLESTWIDARCEHGIDALKQYQFKFDDDKKVFLSTPRHDWASHACDAAEIIGQVHRNEVKEKELPKPRFLHETTANEVFWGEKGKKTTIRY